MNKDIWVYCETSGSLPIKASLELLAKARELADKNNAQAVAVLPGHNLGEAAGQVLGQGADTVIKIETQPGCHTRPYATAIAGLAAKYQPGALLFAATSQGRDLAPRIQAKLNTGLTADCLDLDMDNGLLIQTKPSYGDNIMCQITTPLARPQMATVRPGVFTVLPFTPNNNGRIIDEQIKIEPDPDCALIEQRPLPEIKDDISGAQVIIALGQGASGQRAVDAAWALAGKLRGTVAVTRPLSDSGQFNHELVIGHSGSTVKPRLIINLGISGAIQYLAGMSQAEIIVAVNTDPDAPIMRAAHYAIVDDAEKVLNALLAEVSGARAGN